jgi:hypothetical protein
MENIRLRKDDWNILADFADCLRLRSSTVVYVYYTYVGKLSFPEEWIVSASPSAILSTDVKLWGYGRIPGGGYFAVLNDYVVSTKRIPSLSEPYKLKLAKKLRLGDLLLM